MQTGLYETEEEFKQREAEEAQLEQELAEQRIFKASRDYRDKEHPHADIEAIIDKTIEFLISTEHSDVLEKVLNESDDLRFGFLRKNHVWHQHYVERRSEASAAQEKPKASLDQSRKTGPEDVDMEEDRDNMAAGQSSIAHLSEAETSAKESRAAEMRRLDRLQRIKELFQQKHKKDVTQTEQDGGGGDPASVEQARSPNNPRPRTRSISPSRSPLPSIPPHHPH